MVSNKNKSPTDMESSFQYADPSDEPTAPFYDQTFEEYDLSIDVWKGETHYIKASK